jgi:hypothetical protein
VYVCFALEALLRYTRRAKGASEIERRAEAGGHQSILLWNSNLIHAIHPLANYDIDENDI